MALLIGSIDAAAFFSFANGNNRNVRSFVHFVGGKNISYIILLSWTLTDSKWEEFLLRFLQHLDFFLRVEPPRIRYAAYFERTCASFALALDQYCRDSLFARVFDAMLPLV